MMAAAASQQGVPQDYTSFPGILLSQIIQRKTIHQNKMKNTNCV